VTAQDKQTALVTARNLLASHKAQIQAFLAKPCTENLLGASIKMIVTWSCQFAMYHVPSYMRVLGAKLAGNNFFVTVEFIPPPQRIWAK
jgi:hypothetical protein